MSDFIFQENRGISISAVQARHFTRAYLSDGRNESVNRFDKYSKNLVFFFFSFLFGKIFSLVVSIYDRKIMSETAICLKCIQ